MLVLFMLAMLGTLFFLTQSASSGRCNGTAESVAGVRVRGGCSRDGSARRHLVHRVPRVGQCAQQVTKLGRLSGVAAPQAL